MQSGDIDPDALAAVLDSLNLAEFIPSRITAPSTTDIEDAMVPPHPAPTALPAFFSPSPQFPDGKCPQT